MSKRRYSLSMLERHWRHLESAFANVDGHERAAYLFCRRAVTPSEVRLVVQGLELVSSEHIVSSARGHVSISSRSYVRALARADRLQQCFVLVHNHPDGYPTFSSQDDREEEALIRTAFTRAVNGPHGSVILVGGQSPRLIGRLWLDERQHVPMDRIRIVGKRMRIFDYGDCGDNSVPQWADRQVRAFGAETQKLLSKLHVGVVGAGGTGSAVCEQLIRLGVGQLTVIDEQVFENSNVNRVFGSTLFDEGLRKVNIVKRQAATIATGTTVTTVSGTVCDRDTARVLRDCDVVFGCTDDNFGRAVLNRLAIWYYIPVIDSAVVVDSDAGTIREVTGRVTMLLPGGACLRCRGRISQPLLEAVILQRRNPSEYVQRAREGYVAELHQRNPAVVMFTAGIAARALMEFMHLLTGFMGDDRRTSEVLERFHLTEVRTNDRTGCEGCYCMSPDSWGMADQESFLGLNW